MKDQYIINKINMGNGIGSFEGDIYKGDEIIRKGACKHYRTIDNTHKLKASLRAGEWAWPGGYACFFVTSDGATLSFEAVLENLQNCLDSTAKQIDDGWAIVGMDCTANCDETIYCDHTGKEIA